MKPTKPFLPAATLVCVAGLVVSCGHTHSHQHSQLNEERDTPMVNVKSLWNAYEQDEDGPEKLLGQIAIENGVLTIVSLADEGEREFLQEIIDNYNAMPNLAETAPPAAGSQRYTMGAKTYERGAEGFDEALIRKLEKNHGLRLAVAE